MTPFTFTGEQTDASTGLEYLRARYYDADTGRFLSPDPLGDGYDYAYDNPVMFTDPSGLSPVSAEACGDIKDRISNLNGGAPKIEERIRRIWQSVYDTWCGPVGGGPPGEGGGGLYCGWTTDCSNGRGCDSTAVSRASAPVEGACWFDDEQPHRLRWSDILPPQKDCGGLLKKIGCYLDRCEGKLLTRGAVMVVGGAGTTALGTFVVKRLTAAAAAEGGVGGLELLHGALAGGVTISGGTLLEVFGVTSLVDACLQTNHRFDKR
jgi:RHS repeat-associated protein